MAPDRESQTSRLAKAEAANQIASTRSMYRTTFCEKVVSEAKRMAEEFRTDPEWESLFKIV